MATGINNLPFPGKVYNPFDILTAEELNEDVANIESLADGSGIGDGAITPDKRAGGFATGTLNGNSATVTISNLGFRPKAVEFAGLWSDSTSFAQTFSGVAVDGSPISNYSSYMIVGSTGLVARTSSATHCIRVVSTVGAVQNLGAVTSFTSTGFVVSFTATQNTDYYFVAYA